MITAAQMQHVTEALREELTEGGVSLVYPMVLDVIATTPALRDRLVAMLNAASAATESAT